MMQAEIEAKLKSLGEQLSLLQEQQRSRDKGWVLTGTLNLLVGVGMILTGFVLLLRYGAPLAISLMLTGAALTSLGVALYSGVKSPR